MLVTLLITEETRQCLIVGPEIIIDGVVEPPKVALLGIDLTDIASAGGKSSALCLIFSGTH